MTWQDDLLRGIARAINVRKFGALDVDVDYQPEVSDVGVALDDVVTTNEDNHADLKIDLEGIAEGILGLDSGISDLLELDYDNLIISPIITWISEHAEELFIDPLIAWITDNFVEAFITPTVTWFIETFFAQDENGEFTDPSGLMSGIIAFFYYKIIKPMFNFFVASDIFNTNVDGWFPAIVTYINNFLALIRGGN